MADHDRTNRITDVVKYGGSVLRDDRDLLRLAQDAYGLVRRGKRLVVVTSAFHGRTDALLAHVDPDGHASDAAAYVAIGEVESSLRVTLALQRAGLEAKAIPARDVGIATVGDPLDARIASVDPQAVRRAARGADVVVVPGFVGTDDHGALTLLGRGGSDLTAIALAAALDAECTLVKDVDGVYERDPRGLGDEPRRFASLRFDTARSLGGRVVQRKALDHAAATGTAFRIRALCGRGGGTGTRVGGDRDELAPRTPQRRVRVALLGLGVVGLGVYDHLRARPDRFELVGVAVRDPARERCSEHFGRVPDDLLTSDARRLAARADLVIEVIGGLEPPRTIAGETLARGAAFVTANKALVAESGAALAACALGTGGSLHHSAAVGGAVPCLELLDRLREAGETVVRLEGILNGTCQWIANAVARGAAFDDAVRDAIARGYAEADPSRDLDGIDACDKIAILAEAAFGEPPCARVPRGLRELTAADAHAGVRLVARAWRDAERVHATVAPEPVAGTLATLGHACGNALEVTTARGATHVVRGIGAGRWPTAISVIADALDACERLVASNAARTAGGVR
ncbi:MAG: hypothetical protein JNM94_09130 [Phycisphaerae bacterium]|nr:hypothetical protein [Phycisphaerae bacterium]